MASGISPSTFTYVQRLTQAISGVVVVSGKEYLVESRLGPIARAVGMATIDELVATLGRRPVGQLHVEVVEAMSTTETSFFRDHAPFEALRLQILPELIAARSAGRQLRICSAASSSGQEAYSLAMLLLEHFAEFVAGGGVRIFGFDMSQAMLQRAQAGTYRVQEVNRGLPARYLTRYFRRRGLEWDVRPEVRDLVEFRRLNLVTEPLPPALDVVLLRNVLMYFDSATRLRVLETTRQSLARDGALLVGTTETLFAAPGFRRSTVGRADFYRPQQLAKLPW